MRRPITITLLAVMLVPGIAWADDDDWEDEGDNGWNRWEGNGWSGETPDWARGRGYWDGHYRGFGSGYWRSPGFWIDSGVWGDARPWTFGVSGYNGRTFPHMTAANGLVEAEYPELRRMAHGSLLEFHRWLGGVPAGEVWQKHFETRTVLDLLARDKHSPPAAAELETLVRVLGMFDQAVENAELNSLTRVGSFRATHSALRELAMAPEERRVRQLSSSARHLNRELSGIATGAKWQGYLALPDEILAAADRPAGPINGRRQLKTEELAQILERFDRVSRLPEYRAIAALPAFQMTHERLTNLLHPQDETPDEPSDPPALALPPPPEPDNSLR